MLYKFLLSFLYLSFLFNGMFVVAGDQNSYILAEGVEADQRLKFQHDLVKDELIKAFKKLSSIKNLKNSKIVDFGCGTSAAYHDIKNFIGDKGEYIGIDFSEKQISFNKQKFPNVTYIAGDESAPQVIEVFKNADIIYMRYVIMHQKQPAEFIKHIYRLLKPGAVLILQEPEETANRKAEMAKKYPFAAELCDFKKILGERRGLDYNYARKINELLQKLQPSKIIHVSKDLHITLSDAKKFLEFNIKEVANKDKNILTAEEVDNYLKMIDKLPDSKEEYWTLDHMHTFIVIK